MNRQWRTVKGDGGKQASLDDWISEHSLVVQNLSLNSVSLSLNFFIEGVILSEAVFQAGAKDPARSIPAAREIPPPAGENAGVRDDAFMRWNSN